MPARAPAPAALAPAVRYARCEAIVVTLEGAYVDNPKDAGGPTKWGVTQRALSLARGRICTAADVAALTRAEAAALYRTPYWAAVHGDELPPGVDLIVFDAAVNCGRGHAVRVLQTALGLEADGAFGAATAAALTACDDAMARIDLVARIRLARASFYASLPAWPTFGRGWTARLHTVSATAVAWAAKS